MTTLFSCLSGSNLYGTSDPANLHDVDTFAVEAKDRLYYLGMDGPEGLGSAKQTMEAVAGVMYDTTTYELRHFAKLALAGNPAVLPMLWTPARYATTLTVPWAMVVAHRDAFVSQRAVAAFKGMAYNEQKKFEAAVGTGLEKLPWKSAMHTQRLLAMLAEFLFTENFVVDRRGVDAELLVQVRQGRMSVKATLAEFAVLHEVVGDALATTRVPEQPDRQRVSRVVADALTQVL
jgi:predicted nucleotidyltransferase